MSLSNWPVARPDDWMKMVNDLPDEDSLEKIKLSLSRGVPYGTKTWIAVTAENLGLGSTLRQKGRPLKGS